MFTHLARAGAESCRLVEGALRRSGMTLAVVDKLPATVQHYREQLAQSFSSRVGSADRVPPPLSHSLPSRLAGFDRHCSSLSSRSLTLPCNHVSSLGTKDYTFCPCFVLLVAKLVTARAPCFAQRFGTCTRCSPTLLCNSGLQQGANQYRPSQSANQPERTCQCRPQARSAAQLSGSKP